MGELILNEENLLGKEVLFRTTGPHDDFKTKILRNGEVVLALDDRGTASICYAWGAKGYTDSVPYVDIVAIKDVEAPQTRIENYTGHFIDLRR